MNGSEMGRDMATIGMTRGLDEQVVRWMNVIQMTFFSPARK